MSTKLLWNRTSKRNVKRPIMLKMQLQRQKQIPSIIQIQVCVCVCLSTHTHTHTLDVVIVPVYVLWWSSYTQQSSHLQTLIKYTIQDNTLVTASVYSIRVAYSWTLASWNLTHKHLIELCHNKLRKSNMAI